MKRILTEFYGIENAVILRTKNGKPYVESGPHFSVSHTNGYLFVAFSSENVGLDAELLSRKIHYLPIVKKFSTLEQTEILNEQDFLYHWTAKESAVKYLGGTLANDLKKLSFIRSILSYQNEEFPVKIHFFTIKDCLLAVCSEKDFDTLNLYYYNT